MNGFARSDSSSNGVDDLARRRRFRRRHTDASEARVTDEAQLGLQAELILLREENARLKVAHHRAPDVVSLLARARSRPAAELDHDNVNDETTRVLVEGLVIRESLLEICEDIKHIMGSYAIKLRALEAAAAEPIIRRASA